MDEQRLDKAKAGGSNPLPSTNKNSNLIQSVKYCIILSFSEGIGMKNTKFVVIDPKLKEYTVFDGREQILKAKAEYHLYPSEIEELRVNSHADELFDGEDPDGDLVA